tara:strand:- start:868 stop:1074 length:207 start_codon:yes stop_codon:yes gene_type:complete
MADDDIKRKVLTDATNIARTIVKEIDSIKADGVPKDIQRKLTTIQTKTKELLEEIRNKVLRQTRLGDF